MQFVQITYDKKDIALTSVYNAQAVTVAKGDSVVWDTGTVDGIRTTQPVTATLSLFVGVAIEDIATLSYGRVQTYGYNSKALITNTTGQAITAGDILIPVNAVDYLARSGASDGKSGFVFAAAAVGTATTPAAALSGVFIRAL